MKKMLLGILAIGVIAVIGFFLGPRPDQTVSVNFDPASLGNDLDAYLSEAEASVTTLLPGAEKEIIWADPATKSKTPLAIVYVHGFSATKHELRPVPDRVAGELGANLYFTRLTGHGADGDTLAEATLSDWASDFAEALAIGEQLGDRVIVMATSNGGALTTWGLSKPEFAEKVSGAILFSPAYELQGIATWLANIPWAESILPMVGGEHRSWEPHNELHGKWWTNSYPSRAIFPMTSLLALLKDVDRSEITVPALFVYSPNDQVVVGAEIAETAANWGGPSEEMVLEKGGDPYNHVIAGDILSPQNTDPVSARVTEWIKAL